MVIEALQSYAQLASGLTKTTREKALATAKGLLDQAGLGDVAADTTDRVSRLADELLAASKANRQALTQFVDAEVTKAVDRLGLAKAEDVEALRAEVATLRTATVAAASSAAAAPTAASAPSAPAVKRPAKKAPAKKAPAKKAPAAESAAATVTPAATTAAAASPAKKTTAKKTTAKKTTAKNAPREEDEREEDDREEVPRRRRSPPGKPRPSRLPAPPETATRDRGVGARTADGRLGRGAASPDRSRRAGPRSGRPGRPTGR